MSQVYQLIRIQLGKLIVGLFVIASVYFWSYQLCWHRPASSYFFLGFRLLVTFPTQRDMRIVMNLTSLLHRMYSTRQCKNAKRQNSEGQVVIDSEIESAVVSCVVHFFGDGLFYDKHQGHTNRLTGHNIFGVFTFFKRGAIMCSIFVLNSCWPLIDRCPFHLISSSEFFWFKKFSFCWTLFLFAFPIPAYLGIENSEMCRLKSNVSSNKILNR